MKRATGRTHELKTWPEPFTAIARGEKSWEFRFDDRGFAEGDELELREWDPHAQTYTGRTLRAGVTYILRSSFGLPNGYVIMSLVLKRRPGMFARFVAALRRKESR